MQGEISFDSQGYRMVNIMGIYQYQSQSKLCSYTLNYNLFHQLHQCFLGNTGFELIARVTVTNGERAHFEILKNENDIFRGNSNNNDNNNNVIITIRYFIRCNNNTKIIIVFS